jgi:hypothetical protein
MKTVTKYTFALILISIYTSTWSQPFVERLYKPFTPLTFLIALDSYKTASNEYLIGGAIQLSNNPLTSDIMISKLNMNGDTIWCKFYDHGILETAESIIETSTGEIIAAGLSFPMGANFPNGFISKFNGSGNIQWTKSYGGSYFDYFSAICETPNGAYIAVGSTNSFSPSGEAMLYAVKINNSGDTIWTKTYNIAFPANVQIIRTADNFFLILANGPLTLSSNGIAAYLIKIDTNGNIIWNKKFNHDSDFEFNGRVVTETPDGGILVGAYNYDYMGWNMSTFILTKFNSQGNYLWSRMYAIPGSEDFKSLTTSSNGDILFVASINPGGSLPKSIAVKTDSIGNVIWGKQYEIESIRSHCIMHNNEIDLLFSSYNFSFIRTDSLGTLGCLEQSLNITDSIVGANTLLNFMSFQFTNSTTSSTIFIEAIHDNQYSSLCNPSSDGSLTTTSQFNIYPNPSNSVINVDFSKNINANIANVYNTLGELIKSVTVFNNSRTSIDISTLKNGLYYIELLDYNRQLYRSKFIKSD